MEKRFFREEPDKKAALEKSGCDFLCTLLRKTQGAIGLYKAMPEEFDVSSVVERLADREFAYPRMTAEQSLEFVLNPSEWTTHLYGVDEPLGPTVNLNDLAVILVPGVAFDHRGFRLGMGKGFYDRALKGFSGMTIGIGFNQQVQREPLPVNDWDLPLNFIVTDQLVLNLVDMKTAS
ncbi:MAG: 5-formyltetrahydrofolate cyclo-ligase [Bdellovibrionales bacterium]